jgi:hypothetical protein
MRKEEKEEKKIPSAVSESHKERIFLLNNEKLFLFLSLMRE